MARIFMILAHHANEVMITEEFFSKRVAHQMESIGLYIGEDVVGKLSVTNEDNEFSDYVVGREASIGKKFLGCARGLGT